MREWFTTRSRKNGGLSHEKRIVLHAASTLMASGAAGAATTPIPLWFEIGSFVVLIAVLLFDLLYVVKRPHIPSMKEAAL